MDKSLAGLLGAVGALAAATPSPAAASAPVNLEAAMQATSYADLLKPIPNALALWKASAETPAPATPMTAEDDATVQTVQYHDHHHHHHHHHHHRRRHIVVVAPPVLPLAHHHHHHHHHHHAAVVVVPPQS